ncbi:MAG: penicillin-binding transpeptidase domain-containing protein [Phycisphaerales bacterium JB043]
MTTRTPIFTSMFQRRVTLLFVLLALAMCVVSVQLVRLTVVEGTSRRLDAHRPLTRERWVETTRGAIRDRKGRVLAEDRPSFDVLVEYPMVTGAWVYEQAAREARQEHAEEWAKLDVAQRDALIERYAPIYHDRLHRFWDAIAELSSTPRADLEQRRARIMSRVSRAAITVWERRRLERLEEWTREKESAQEITLRDVARPIREEREPHVILRDVSDEIAFAMRRLSEEFDGLQVRDGQKRHYPFESVEVEVDRSLLPSPIRDERIQTVLVEGVATHTLGWMRDRVFAEDVKRRPRIDPETGELDRGHYRTGDSIGAWGIEEAFESTLRGLRGVDRTRRDTGETVREEPVGGADVDLTLDIMLQARVQASLNPDVGLARVQGWHENTTISLGGRLGVGIVVLEIGSGDILASASGPTFTRSMVRNESERVFEDPILAPWVDRALGRAYAPASIVKPLILCESIAQGVTTTSRMIACNGHYLENRTDILRCWIWRERYGMLTHSMQLEGPLSAHDAIARSCQIYFYTLGQELNPGRMAHLYRKLGVETGLRIGLPISSGVLGTGTGPSLQMSDAIMMATGQGPLGWTPLHAANAHATLARGGVLVEPRIVSSIEQSSDRVRTMDWSREAIDKAMLGMELAVRDQFGTSHHLTIDGVFEPIFHDDHLRIIGKTGTGQASPSVHDADGDGPLPAQIVRRGDHAWTVALVGPPGGAIEYAIACVVEHGGSGGRVAGPIVNMAIRALIDEGYLPDDEQRASAR